MSETDGKMWKEKNVFLLLYESKNQLLRFAAHDSTSLFQSQLTISLESKILTKLSGEHSIEWFV